MFYLEEFDKETLRFGDVLQGYIHSELIIGEPYNEISINEYKYQIDTVFPKFSVVMTPCCSIGKNTISLAPLRKIDRNFFRHPDVINDFTLLNREIEPQLTFPPEYWDNMDEEEQKQRSKVGKSLEFLSYFFYKQTDLFPEYEIQTKNHTFKSSYYMVDFKTIHSLTCNKIIKDKVQFEILQSKCLELTVYTRKELRDKLAYYFGRAAPEDEVYLH